MEFYEVIPSQLDCVQVAWKINAAYASVERFAAIHHTQCDIPCYCSLSWVQCWLLSIPARSKQLHFQRDVFEGKNQSP